MPLPVVPTAALSPAWGVSVLCTPSAIPFRITREQNILIPLGKIFAKLLMKLNFFIKNRVRNKTGLKHEKVSDKDVWLFSTEQQKQ